MSLYPDKNPIEGTEYYSYPSLELDPIESIFNTKVNQEKVKLRNKWIEHLAINPFLIYGFHKKVEYYFNEFVSPNSVYLSQTDHEFNISISFFNKIRECKISPKLKCDNSTKYFFSILQLYGNYPGMVIRSVYDGLELIREKCDLESLKKLFIHLFVKYETPPIFVNNIFRFSLLEIEIMMFYFQGNNISRSKKLKIEFSKKDSYYFINKLPEDISFLHNVFINGIVLAKLLALEKESPEFALSFVKAMNNGVGECTETYNYWKSVYLFICELKRSKDDNANFYMHYYIDFFEYHKMANNEDYIFKNKTVQSIEYDVILWHGDYDFLELKDCETLEWKGENIDPMHINYNGVMYFFEEITDGKRLALESKKMHHCVFSYVKSCYNGYSFIWSMKIDAIDCFQHYITIEKNSEGEIIQIFKDSNKMPNDNDLKVIEMWKLKNIKTER